MCLTSRPKTHEPSDPNLLVGSAEFPRVGISGFVVSQVLTTVEQILHHAGARGKP